MIIPYHYWFTYGPGDGSDRMDSWTEATEEEEELILNSIRQQLDEGWEMDCISFDDDKAFEPIIDRIVEEIKDFEIDNIKANGDFEEEFEEDPDFDPFDCEIGIGVVLDDFVTWSKESKDEILKQIKAEE